MAAFGQAPERVYKGELLNFPGAWAYRIDDPTIILTTDEELEIMAADPSRVLNLALTHAPMNDSLQQICERAQRAGQRRIKIAFDQFFKQYRPGQDTPRRLMPDSDEYIQKIAAISRFAARYNLGLELSLLTPLETGPSYVKATGESGRWFHYREGVRDPVTGAFSVELWRQRRWVNNKGPVDIAPDRIRAFAFTERALGGTPYRVVDPKSIVEIKTGVTVEVYEGLVVKNGDFQAQRIRVHGTGSLAQSGLDKVLVVQEYRTPEMDYFSPNALRFLENLVDRYLAAGVNLQGLYSDEMHIQGDWVYFRHHDHGEFALRYVSDGLSHRYAELYGPEYRDLAPYMIYFAYGQEDTATDLSAKRGIMHVFGSSPEDVRRTALFRARYYHLLQDGVVDLFTAAKQYAERKVGHRLDARYHATWAQSPTIDYWEVGRRNPNPYKYEYTSNFVWSNTVQQAATACYDYFKWGDFLTGNGSDHTEGGWLDRNYYALAMAASIGILNEVPNAYGAHWGMPDVISNQRMNLVIAYGDGPPAFYGAGNAAIHGAVQDMEHRDVSVLMLYPMDLVAVEERFGSWMTQYGYANYVTAAKLLERGKVVDGAIEMAGRRFTTLAATFEPFPSSRLLSLMREFVNRGGRLVWSGPPPVLTAEGGAALSIWQELFGVDYTPDQSEGLIATGAQVRFSGVLAAVTSQIILTDLLPDHIYPVTPRMGVTVAATVKETAVGTHRASRGGGTATFLGYRPRDDQAQSLGYDTRNWFEVLDALGAYPGSSNTERISRTGTYLATRFTNGAITVAPHLRNLEESWAGGFSRNAEKDRQAMAAHPPPSDSVRLRDFNVGSHRVTYDGQGAVTFRIGSDGALEGFAGNRCRAIAIDGRQTTFSGKEVEEIGWAPIAGARRIAGGAVAQIWVRGPGAVSIPIKGVASTAKLYVEGEKPGSRGAEMPATIADGVIHFTVNDRSSGRFIYVVP
ncbi:MAG: hypothetical protein IT168_11655 [Bryobacterales bacterium]|nr:hypothetical protein [Bryobacterales bacterium]